MAKIQSPAEMKQAVTEWATALNAHLAAHPWKPPTLADLDEIHALAVEVVEALQKAKYWCAIPGSQALAKCADLLPRARAARAGTAIDVPPPRMRIFGRTIHRNALYAVFGTLARAVADPATLTSLSDADLDRLRDGVDLEHRAAVDVLSRCPVPLEPARQLTVSEAAHLMDEKRGVPFDNAKRRISGACNTGKLTHSGPKGERRIPEGAFRVWLEVQSGPQAPRYNPLDID